MEMSTAVVYIAGALMMSFGALGASLGISSFGGKSIEVAPRLPELLLMLRTQFFIVVGLGDALPMIAVGLSMYVLLAVVGG